MAYHENFFTTYKQIVDYYKTSVHEEDLNIDFVDLHNRCWNCGEIAKLYRCHIIPSSANGKDEPCNYVLLCRTCHENAPNCISPDIMWDWLNSNKFYCYDTYKGQEIINEYKRIYNKDLVLEIETLFHNNDELFYKLLDENIMKVKLHIGNGGINISTWVGMWNEIFKNFREYNIKN